VRVTAASHETITPSAEGTAALVAAYARYRDLYPALAATSRSAAAFQAAETGDA